MEIAQANMADDSIPTNGPSNDEPNIDDEKEQKQGRTDEAF